MTIKEIIEFKGTSDDLDDSSDDYYAMRAWENLGCAIRDNTYLEWVSIGKAVERGDYD